MISQDWLPVWFHIHFWLDGFWFRALFLFFLCCQRQKVKRFRLLTSSVRRKLKLIWIDFLPDPLLTVMQTKTHCSFLHSSVHLCSNQTNCILWLLFFHSVTYSIAVVPSLGTGSYSIWQHGYTEGSVGLFGSPLTVHIEYLSTTIRQIVIKAWHRHSWSSEDEPYFLDPQQQLGECH